MKLSLENKTFRLKTILRFLTMCAFSLCATTTPASQYHVDATLGKDHNPGTEQAPWQTIAKVNAGRFQPGDKILFKRGESWHESLIIPSSGTRDNHIVFGAYGEGPPPLIDCTSALNENRQQMKDEIYSFPWPRQPGVLFYRGMPKPAVMSLRFIPENTPPKGAILLQLQKNTPYTNLWVIGSEPQTGLVTGLSVFEEKWDTKRNVTMRRANPTTGIEEQLPPMGPPLAVTHEPQSLLEPGHWYWADGKIYLRCKGDPRTAHIRVSDIQYGINTKGHGYLTIENLAVRGAGTVGIYLLNSNHCRISGNHILGTGLLTHSTAILFMNASDNLVRDNLVEHSLGTGISVYAYDGLSHRNTVAANTVLDSGASGIMIGGEVDFRVQYTLVTHNTVERSNQIAYDSAGIYSYFCGAGNIIEHNVIRDGGSTELKSSGIMIDTDSGPMIVRYNTIEQNSHGGIVVTEKGHFIHHNHLANNAPTHWKTAEIVFFPVNDDVSGCEVTDNHLQTGPDTFLFRIAKGSEQAHFIDRNTYIGGRKTPFVWQEQELDFRQWQKTTGADTHSTHQADR